MKLARSTFDQRKEDILEAAVTVFASDGYHKVTTADVSREAGISQPYIYRFFTSKEELFLAVVDRVYGRIAAEFRAVPTGPGAELRLIQCYDGLMRTHPREIRLQVQTWGLRDDTVRRRVANALLSLTALVEQALMTDGAADARARAETFLARGALCNLALALDEPGLFTSRLQ